MAESGFSKNENTSSCHHINYIQFNKSAKIWTKPRNKEPFDIFTGACPLADFPTLPVPHRVCKLPVSVMEVPHLDLTSRKPAAQCIAD